MASPSEGNELSLERDIKPSFRTKDRDSMLQAFDLFDYEDVVEHADAIVGALRGGADALRRRLGRFPGRQAPAVD